MSDTTGVQVFAAMRTQLANNLKLLSTQEFVRRRKEDLIINEDTFKKLTPKAFQLITYHLFQTVDPEECRKRFIGCFPVLDRKQEGEFRQITNKWLQEIAAKETSCHFPRVVPIYFQHFTPEVTVCHLYLDFSNYCLRKHIQRVSGSQLQIKPYGEISCEDVSVASDGYQRLIQEIRDDTDEWRQRMTYFVAEYHKTNDSLKSWQQKKDQLCGDVQRKHHLNGESVEQFIGDRFNQLASDVNALKSTVLSMNKLVDTNWISYANAIDNKNSVNSSSIDLHDVLNKSDVKNTSSVGVMAQELITFARNYDSILENVTENDLKEFSHISDEFLAEVETHSQQMRELTAQMESMSTEVKGLADRHRAELLSTPEIQERRQWFQRRIPDISAKLSLRLEPKRRESLGLITEIVDKVEATHEGNAVKEAVMDDDSPVYRGRPSLYDYSFQVMDISTCHYIAPSGSVDDSRLFSPIENKTKSVFNS